MMMQDLCEANINANSTRTKSGIRRSLTQQATNNRRSTEKKSAGGGSPHPCCLLAPKSASVAICTVDRSNNERDIHPIQHNDDKSHAICHDAFEGYSTSWQHRVLVLVLQQDVPEMDIAPEGSNIKKRIELVTVPHCSFCQRMYVTRLVVCRHPATV
jgi:hypothetical protein